VSAIAAKVDPGLVDINTDLSYEGEAAAGTGIVLTSNGEILTNNHVIDGATSISVTDIGNGKTYNANVVGYDRTSDVAVIQLVGASGLTTDSLGNSSNVSVGNSVVGIGNAGGAGGKPSTAGGSVTALNQAITASDDDGGNSENLTGLIETNANIQPGDSGGALVTSSGTVIGMDTAADSSDQYQSTSTTSFAIPINTALSLAQKIENHDASTTIHIGRTAFLGVEVEPASSAGSGSGSGGFSFGFGSGSSTGGSGSSSSTGATIVSAVSGGAAANAGLAEGDTITSFNGTTVDSPTTLTTLLLQAQPGQKVTVGYVDGSGNQQTVSVTLGSGPPQ